MKLFLAIFVLLIVSVISGSIRAHELTLDDNGCHRDGMYGKYHCHEGNYAGESFISMDDYPGATNHLPELADYAPIKMNRSGVCVTPDSVLYNRQTKYRVYQSVKECLRYGGHLDRTLVLRD